MPGILSLIFGGDKSQKDVKKINPLVQEINECFEQYHSLTNDELRHKSVEFKKRISDYTASIDESINQKQEEAEKLDTGDIDGRDTLYRQIDELKDDRDKKIEEILNEILPEAFAVMKETAKRFKENKEIVSTATDLDRDLSVTKNYITIDGDKAIYKNQWEAGGNLITWDMLHYDVQLIGGIVLHQGKIAEMATGEGKTLVSTLPAYLNALPGLGVHIVTVNDYLAKRDSEWNGPLYEWLGLRVDCIDKYKPNSEERQRAYKCDIIYGTNNEFGFDYLRDNMVHSPEEMVQGKHHYAMVDEVDSVLIDDARTPLIISGPIPQGDKQEFDSLKPRVEKIVEAQRRVATKFLSEAKKLIEEGNDSWERDGGGLALYRAHRGLPKNKALIKYLSEPGMKVKLQKTENHFLADQEKNMHIVDEELYFVIDEKQNTVQLTDKGIALITKSGEDPDFFILPDVGARISDIEKSSSTEEEKLQKKEEFLKDYREKAERIHTTQQLLKAYTLFERDDEYVVIDGQVKIVDEQTGRIMEGRRYSDGLHQAIEAKESVKIESATQTYATITLQNYFRMYHKLAGMTGTAETEAAEFWDIYKLDVVSIPTNEPVIRNDNQDLVYKTKREKYHAVIEEVLKLKNAGRPVLVGTTSVEVSELLSRMMTQNNVEHSVLNAKQHAREAQIVVEAGLAGHITIATNMAGRGTDIKLGPGVKEAGGLAIVGTERHESRRVDRQLRGRSGRQGDPGSSQFFVSLEDDLMRMFGSERIASLMDRMGYKEGEVIQHKMISKSIERAQKKVEENNFGIRKRLLEYDDVMNKQRNVIYGRRNHALFGERLALDLDNAFYSNAEALIFSFKEVDNFDEFKLSVIMTIGMDTAITKEELQKEDTDTLSHKLYYEAKTHYNQKVENLAKQTLPVIQKIRKEQSSSIINVAVPFTDGKKALNIIANIDKTIETGGKELVNSLEKNVTLALIDEIWKEHLRAMDDLRHSVQSTAGYEQKDPLIIYKIEAFNAFKEMNDNVNKQIVSFLTHCSIPVEQTRASSVLEEQRRRQKDRSQLKQRKEAFAGAEVGGENGPDYIGGSNEYHDPSDTGKQEPIVAEPKIGRNDPCPCGSGKKYKNCHGRK